MSNYEKQSAEADRLHTKWWGAFRELATEIGARIMTTLPDMVDVELPDDWTQEAFFEEVDRRAGRRFG